MPNANLYVVRTEVDEKGRMTLESHNPATTLAQEMGSVTSASSRVGNLLRRAMTFFETNREVAWRCLMDASTLLDSEAQESVINAPTLQSPFRPGGLAAWQAKRTVAYIEANLGSKIAIGAMADLVALSTSQFSRAFKQSLGSRPKVYVGLRRVERAKLMMTSTSERLADIALACGFADQSHFNRYFRRVVGMSPRRWRRMFESPGGVGEVPTATVSPAVANAVLQHHTSPASVLRRLNHESDRIDARGTWLGANETEAHQP
jgi:AraC family transcriptional regulator